MDKTGTNKKKAFLPFKMLFEVGICCIVWPVEAPEDGRMSRMKDSHRHFEEVLHCQMDML